MSELCHVYGTLDTVSGMSGLSDLQLESLGIGGGLDAIYDKYALQYLNLGGTALSGSVSSGFDNLTGLIWINL